MTEPINPEFEAYVKAELGDIAGISEGCYISPKIQNYYKLWQHREAQLKAAKNQWVPVSKRLPKEGDCGWTFDVDQGMYDTGCGQAWIFSEGLMLAENKVKFCPFCSGAVKEST
jgi:hypothetical protein